MASDMVCNTAPDSNKLMEEFEHPNDVHEDAKLSPIDEADVANSDNSPVEENKKEQTFCEIFCEEIVMLKWRVLILACFMTFGGYYIFDFPGSIGTGGKHTIQGLFHKHNKKYDNAMNLALYSVYSYPNCFLALLGGLLIDKYLGLRKSTIVFISCIFTGSLLFFIGVVVLNYPLMLFARLIFGLGGESICVSQNTFVARYFTGSGSGRGVALAFTIVIAFARVGSSFNFLFSPLFADHSVELACIAGIVACFISVCANVSIVLLDLYAVRKGIVGAETGGNSDTAMQFSDIPKLPAEVWLLCGICVFNYGSVLPFVTVAKNMFQKKYGNSPATASAFVSVYMFGSAGFSPIIGVIVSSVGRFTFWLIASSAFFVIIHIILLTTPIPPYVVTAFMGLCYAFCVSSLWPAVPYVVKDNLVGFCYGLMTAIQNIGLATFPLIAGIILDANTDRDASGKKKSLATMKGYRLADMVFILSGFLAFICSLILFIVNKKHKGPLALNAADAKEFLSLRLARVLEEEQRRNKERENAAAAINAEEE